MRSIYDIAKELQAHPDFVACDLWTKEMVIDDLVAHYEGDYYTAISAEDGVYDSDISLDIEISLEDLNDEDWADIEDQIINSYTEIESPIKPNKLKDLNKRLRRKINLDNLLEK
jgi:hypothetical protein